MNANTPSPSANGQRSYLMQRTIGGILWLVVGVALLVMWRTTPRNPELASPQKSQPEPAVEKQEIPEPELVTRDVADFSLTERGGETVTKDDLLGRPWVVNFIFTKCVMSCPQNTKAMMELAEKCEDTKARFVTITVDPERDTPEVLRQYTSIYGADPEQWLFLTGDKQKIHDLIRNSFLQVVQERTGDDRMLGYEFAHTDRVMHIDETGTIVGQYLSTDPKEMTQLARVLKGERETAEDDRFLVPKSVEEPAEAENVEATESVSTEEGSSDKQQEEADFVKTTEVSGGNPEANVEVPAWLNRLPAVNATLNGIATILLIFGFVLIKRKKVTAHKRTMLTAFGVSVLFLASYLTYHFGLQHYTGESSKTFPDLGLLRQIYLTILFSHIILAVPVPILAGITIYHGLRNSIDKHRTIARVTYPIWLYVSVTGVIIYVLLYQVAGV